MATTNAHSIVVALQQSGQDVEREVGEEIHSLAGLAARTMQRLLPQSEGLLLKSISVKKTGPMEYEIRPGVDYGYYVEKGVRPGGNGLPRMTDPKSASIVAWLRRTAPSKFMGPQPLYKKRGPRAGSKAFQAAELALRDRYHGLITHIRRNGLQAQPFVEPTAREMEPVVIERVNMAVRRALAARWAS